MTMDQLKELIELAKSGTNNSTEGLADAIAKGISASTRRKVTFGEYEANKRTSFHPDPLNRKQLSRPYFQNGGAINFNTVFDEEVELLNRITHSGRYIDRLVEVSVRDSGGGEETVHITYNNKKDKISELMDHVERKRGDKSKFQAILRMIVEAQEMEDLEREEQRATLAARRR